ncbi:MAG: PRC-barrel domain containing protein [Chitinivibrionales bacterium]|nr:PRC-barrel domain containing protein [Chitinivibrionales bacterium]
MLRSSNSLTGLTVNARDGEIGSISDLYIDGLTWEVRYVIVESGPWLLQKHVLISPVSFREPGESEIAVELTKEQVKNSPSVDTKQPVSRQKERELHTHYGWPYYWESAPYLGTTSVPMESPVAQSLFEKTQEDLKHRRKDQNDLRSVEALEGYHLRACDEETGHVEDFIVDTQQWVMRYLIIDTRNWVAGKRVLISPAWISDISWNASQLHCVLSAEEIRKAPEYDPAQPVNRQYEELIYDYYGRPRYWANPRS